VETAGPEGVVRWTEAGPAPGGGREESKEGPRVTESMIRKGDRPGEQKKHGPSFRQGIHRGGRGRVN